MGDYQLTAQQEIAINYDDNMVVTASPGSGKTTVITEKIRSVSNKILDHQGVIAITFTVKASQELKQRCRSSNFNTKQSFFGTIDSFCLKELILPFLSHLWGGDPAECSVIKRLSEQQAQDFPEDKDIYNFINSQEGLKIIRDLYDNKTLWMGSFSTLALLILRESVSARRYIVAKYTHVFIDEYQDTSEAQHNIFVELVTLGLIGTAVGDEDQSIYEFRGSSPKHINELKLNSSVFRSFPIDINHRSHPSIINYASRLLDPTCNLLLHDKDDCRVHRHYLSGSPREAAAHISSWITEWKEKNQISSLSEVAIFSKKEATLRLISDGINVKNRLYIDTPLDKLDCSVANLYSDLLAYKFCSIETAQEIIDKYISNNNVKLNIRDNVSKLRFWILQLRNQEEVGGVISIFTEIATLLEETSTAEVEAATSEILGNEMLSNLFRPIDENEVQLLTLHKSKGLEFQLVFHFDLEEWSFPYREYTGNWDDPPSYPNLTQETNLHYVGITRAKKACILIRTEKRRNANGDFKNSKPSYFLCLPQLEGLYR